MSNELESDPDAPENLGHFAGDPRVPRSKFALRGAFARQINLNRKLIKRDETLRQTKGIVR